MRVAFIILPLWPLLAGTCFAQSAASVIFVSGHAQIIAGDGQSRAAQRGGDVTAGETIETTDGRVQLRFRDGANMSLQPETRFKIDEFRFTGHNGKAGSDDHSFFSLLKGGFRTITGLIGKHRREEYRVDTAVATIGIRGTDYGAHYGESGLSVNTFGGLVEVCNEAGCEQAAPGDKVLVTDRKNKPRKTDQGADGVNGAPVIPELPLPKPEELPPSASPTAPSVPSGTYPISSPSYTSPTRSP